MRRGLLLAALIAAPLPALAQGWKVYRFDDSGFAIQTPAQPSVAEGTFRTSAGGVVPTKVYTLTEPDIAYSVTVADFTKAPIDKDAAISEAVKAYGAQGEIKLNVDERIDRQFGRQLSVADKDGGRSTVSVFYVNNKLYELEGRALPPDPASGAGKAVRFQQSLEFINLGAERFRPENQAGGGFGPPGGGRLRARGNFGGGGGFGAGRGGRALARFQEACKGKADGDAVKVSTRRGDIDAVCRPGPDATLVARLDRPPPPPAAFDACQGKKAGDSVTFTTPRGEEEARCVQTPQGLAARPNRPPPGGPPPG